VKKNVRSRQKILNRGESRSEPKRQTVTEINKGRINPWEEDRTLCPSSIPAVKDNSIGIRGR
jgi:hypothetical protein